MTSKCSMCGSSLSVAVLTRSKWVNDICIPCARRAAAYATMKTAMDIYYMACRGCCVDIDECDAIWKSYFDKWVNH